MIIDGSRIIDGLLECTVVGGFSRFGYEVRSRLEHWVPLSSYDMSGKTVVLTGPTSGIGREAAFILRRQNANLVLVARNTGKLDALITELRAIEHRGTITGVVADMSNLNEVKIAAEKIANDYPSIQVLIHNAGALMANRGENDEGIELTIASHVVGPFVMTSRLLPMLQAGNGRVITVSSGGMYPVSLPNVRQGGSLELDAARYDGSRQYALAKRAQVTLNEIWAERAPLVEFHAMHPGWADTPGVQESLPRFRSITKGVLRSSAQGADTIVWLAVDPSLPARSGAFWCDRAPRSVHRLPTTKRADTESARDALWSWCSQYVDPLPSP